MLLAVPHAYSRRSFLGIAAGVLTAGAAGVAAAVSDSSTNPATVSAPASRLGRFPTLGSVPDSNGFLLPPGFSSRVIARSGQVVAGTSYTFLNSPDGAGIVPRTDGGWWLLWNGEVANGGGGVAALQFNAGGVVVAAQGVLTGLNRACAGGITPWGTWLACEEVDYGTVWEVDPTGARPTTQHLAMGRFRHEAATVDGARRVIYLSEDEPDGLFYRFRYPLGGLAGGVLEAAVVGGDGAVTWLAIPDPSAAAAQCRAQVPATRFAGGEGLCIMDGRQVFLTTKGDDRVWRYDVVDERMDVLYQPSPGSVLSGVDNIAVTPGHDLLVCEDGGNMELVAVEVTGRATAVARLTGQPTSELTGVNVSPDGHRVYVGSQRGISGSQGIVYELTGPFPW
jgi:secreted PhoX family phosphatase